MSNSKLISYTDLSPHYNKRKGAKEYKGKISVITPHHMAGNLSVETCGQVFHRKDASSNYGIGTDGRIAMYVEEKNRAWTSGSRENDFNAITIEVANDEIGGQWHVSDKALNSLIELCIDICKRNGIEELNYTGDKNGNLTRHNMFQNTACPGPYLQSKFPYIAEQVNKALHPEPEPEPEPKPEWPKEHIVKSGDTLSGIALKYYGNGDRDHYMFIANANNISNPSLIIVGQKLTIPEYKEEPKPEPKPEGLKVGDKVKIIGTGNGNSYGTSNTAYGIGWTRNILRIYEGRAYPYQVGNNSGITGYYKAEALQKK